MPKTSKPIPKKPKKSFFKNKRFLAVAGVVIVLLTGYYTYHQYQLNEKHKVEVAEFAKLETRMQKTMDQIVATVGQPYELHHGQGCGYVSLKYSRGPLSCSNYYIFAYEINSKAEGDTLTWKMKDLFKDNFSGTHSYTPDEFRYMRGYFYDYFSSEFGVGCDYHYDAAYKDIHNYPNDNYKKKISSSFAAEYMFECGNVVVKPVYQVEKKPY